MSRLRVLALAAVAALSMAGDGTSALSPGALLARYQPVLVLERTEVFRPSAVESFLLGSDVEARGTDGRWTLIGPAGRLPEDDPSTCDGRAAPCLRLNVRDCSPAAGLLSIGCYQPKDVFGRAAAASTVYGRAVTLPDRIVLQYWFFYPYNFWSAQHPQSSFIWRSHEGDWEMATVVLTRVGKPLFAAYSQHCGGRRRDWAKAQKWRQTQRPVVYVAVGSHANYFAPGRHAHDPRCYPEAALIVFRANRITPTDFTGGGTSIGPRDTAKVPTTLVRIDVPGPAWMRYPGAWGETGYFRAPGIEAVAFGQGPFGPAFKKIWRKPLATVLEWRAG